MNPELIAAGVNSILVLIVGWFVRGWALEIKEHRLRDCLRLQALEKDVAFLKGRLFGGIPYDRIDD